MAPISDKLFLVEPEWCAEKCHAVPGSNVIVREDDWGSMISYTLSSNGYQRELANITYSRLASTVPSSSAASERSSNSSFGSSASFFSTALGYKLFSQRSSIQPDPDIDDVKWSEPEPFSSVVSRKAHRRDSGNIIREVLRQNTKTQADLNSCTVRGSNLSARSSSSTLHLCQGTPRSTSLHLSSMASLSSWAKPDVQITKDELEGQVVSTPDAVGEVEKLLELETGKGDEMESNWMNRNGLRSAGIVPLGLAEVGGLEDSVDHRKEPSVISSSSSAVSVEDEATIGKGRGGTVRLPGSGPPPLPPPKDGKISLKFLGDGLETFDMKNRQRSETGVGGPEPVPYSSFTNTLTSSLGSALRFMLRDTEPSRPTSPSLKHGLLTGDTNKIDERPHIIYDWTVGTRIKFSCTVYYAKQFEDLRSRCGIEMDFAKSLSRSANWAAEGGKSRSAFWKTFDEKYIIKTLVDAWNVADLQVLLEIAPSYFQYVDSTVSKPTVLAKVLGFYTVEIRNLETGSVQAKSDLLVIENLFYQQKITKTFDLKGIPGRKVKSETSSKAKSPRSSGRQRTLFDKEWIEEQQKAIVLVYAHSKQILRSALRFDADLMMRCNIMDYSLLVGVNEEEKELVCGLVDTIGSYTFAKTLEYKAKHGLNSVKDIKDVTVMPPNEYEERFLKALDGYFVACPDKWSIPPDESRITKDINDLPSVL